MTAEQLTAANAVPSTAQAHFPTEDVFYIPPGGGVTAVQVQPGYFQKALIPALLGLAVFGKGGFFAGAALPFILDRLSGANPVAPTPAGIPVAPSGSAVLFNPTLMPPAPTMAMDMAPTKSVTSPPSPLPADWYNRLQMTDMSVR